ncbi:unnamed protein product [Dicrocoelium dendriticum]|nr:unnamed protein product [Dicrocoelium dendriticum]
MRQLLGDTCFRPPAENLSNCLLHPPDSDEPDTSNFTDHNVPIIKPPLPMVDSTTCSSLLLPRMATHPRSPSIDRIIESIHSASTDAYAHPSSRPSSAVSLGLNACSPTPAVNTLGNSTFLHPDTDRIQSLLKPKQSGVLTPNQLASLLSDMLQAPTESAAPYSSARNLSGSELLNHAHASSGHSTLCPATHTPLCPVSIPSQYHGSSLSIPARLDLGASNQHVGPVAGSQPLLIPPSDSTSVSSTPGSTPLDSTLVNSQHSDTPSRFPQDTFSLPADLLGDDELPHSPCTVLADRVEIELPNPASLDTFDNSLCHSLPLPAHYSARRRREIPRPGVRPPNPDYFATDSGLLLPSRRRKLRPVADYIFSPSHVRMPFGAAGNSEMSSAYASNPDVIPELQAEQDPMSTNQPNGASLISCVSTAGDGHSSGYQSHSRQSSLESQAMAIHCAPSTATHGLSSLTIPASDSKPDILLTEASPPS